MGVAPPVGGGLECNVGGVKPRALLRRCCRRRRRRSRRRWCWRWRGRWCRRRCWRGRLASTAAESTRCEALSCCSAPDRQHCSGSRCRASAIRRAGNGGVFPSKDARIIVAIPTDCEDYSQARTQSTKPLHAREREREIQGIVPTEITSPSLCTPAGLPSPFTPRNGSWPSSTNRAISAVSGGEVRGSI